MDLSVDGWRDEMRRYFWSIEKLTETALKRIKRDRIQNNLPFDVSFQKYFLQKTNARIADAYKDFLLDENLEGAQSPSIQEANHRNCENDSANVFEMPIILEQPNNQDGGMPFVQSEHQMHGPVVISIPSEPSSIPLEIGLHLNHEQESRGAAVSGSLIECKRNNNNENLNRVGDGGGESSVKSTSTTVTNLKLNEPFEPTVSSSIDEPESVVVASDEGNANALGGELNDNTMPIVRLQRIRLPRATGRGHSNKNRVLPENDVHTPNQTVDPETQLELSNAQQGMEIDVNDKLSLPNVAEESGIVQHTANISPRIGNEDTAGGGLELTITNDGNHPIQMNVQSNSEITSSDRIVVPGDEDVIQRRHGIAMADEDIPHLQYPELVDLTSDNEECVSQAAKNVTKDVHSFASQSQAIIQRRRMENDGAIASGSLSKKLKSVDVLSIKKRHKCEYCDYATVRKWSLTNHIRTHTGERPFDCVVCKKRFTRKETLDRHMKTHRDMFAFVCSNCRLGFSDETQRKVHESRCKAKGYKCHLCKGDFIDKRCLVDHMRSHTGEKLRCLKCRKQFNCNSNLACHMKTHGNLFRFQCSKCRQGFTDEKLWKLHESRCKCKQLECYLCGKKFYQHKGNFLSHMRYKHTGEKRFSCSDCPKQFGEKGNLIRHTKRHH